MHSEGNDQLPEITAKQGIGSDDLCHFPGLGKPPEKTASMEEYDPVAETMSVALEFLRSWGSPTLNA